MLVLRLGFWVGVVVGVELRLWLGLGLRFGLGWCEG